MTYTTRLPEYRSAKDFCIKRISRIVPIYTILTLLLVGILKLSFALLGAYDPDYHLKFRDVTRSLFYIPLNMSPQGTAPFFGGSTLATGWTLNYEFYFYAIFAISLLFGWARWVAFFTWITISLIIIPIVGIGEVSIDTTHSYAWRFGYLNIVTSPMIWEFVGGILACFIYLMPVKFPTQESAWLGVVLAVAFTCWGVSNTDHLFSLTHWGFSYFVLVSVLLIADKTICFVVPNIFLVFGRISFSVYLVHLIVQGWIGLIFTHFPDLGRLMGGVSFLTVLSTLCVTLSFPVNRWLEVGLSEYIRKHLSAMTRRRSADQQRYEIH